MNLFLAIFLWLMTITSLAALALVRANAQYIGHWIL